MRVLCGVLITHAHTHPYDQDQFTTTKALSKVYMAHCVAALRAAIQSRIHIFLALATTHTIHFLGCGPHHIMYVGPCVYRPTHTHTHKYNALYF